MNGQKLHYRFHNPNSQGTAANYILNILIEANKGKVELAMQTAAGGAPGEREPLSRIRRDL